MVYLTRDVHHLYLIDSIPLPKHGVMHTDTVEPREWLRAAGLRVTAPRIAVLEAVVARPHSDADTIAADVRAAIGSVSTQGIYDVLHACVGAGLLRRIEPAGSPALFEARIGDNHHHLVCRRCNAVADVDCAIGPAPCLDPANTHGYAVDEAEVVFWGLCPQCRAVEN